MKKLLYNSVITIFVLLSLFSCQKKNSQYSSLDVFRYNESANIQTLDPAYARNLAIIWPCEQLFSSLVQLDDRLEVKPDVAKKWEISPDGKTYTFTLRNDVYFHKHPNFGEDSTRLVKAKDFVYSFHRILDEKTASPGSWIFKQVANFKALNDSVLQIRLHQPFPAFLGLLSMKYASVVPQEIIEDPNIEFRSHPIGTGPYQFKIWEENVKLVLRKNPLYYEKDANGISLPYLESIAITFLPDKQSAFMQFVQGKLDFISGLDASYKDELLDPEGNLNKNYKNRVKMLKAPYLNTEYLGFNMNDTVQFPKELRKILSSSIDRKKMIAYLKNGIGDASTYSIIPNGLKGAESPISESFTFDEQRARQWILEKSKELGHPLQITLNTNPSYSDIAEFLQRNWQKLGLDVKIDLMPPSTLRQAIATNKIGFFRASWIADYPDAENYLSLFYSKNHTPQGPNYTHFTNQTFDKLYEKALQTVDEEKRISLYQQMNQIINQEAPVVVLFYDETVRFAQKNVEGLGANPMNMLRVKYVKKN